MGTAIADRRTATEALCRAYEVHMTSGHESDAAFVCERMLDIVSESEADTPRRDLGLERAAILTLAGVARMRARSAEACSAVLLRTAVVAANGANQGNAAVAVAARFWLATWALKNGASLAHSSARFIGTLHRHTLGTGHVKEADDALAHVFAFDLLAARSGSSEPTRCPFVALLGSYAPDDAAVHSLMGSIYKKAGTFSLAQRSYISALERNPFLWSAYEALCDMGFGGAQTGDFFTDASCAAFLESSNHRAELAVKKSTSGSEVDSMPATNVVPDLPSGTTTRRGRSGQPAIPEKRESKRTKLVTTVPKDSAAPATTRNPDPSPQPTHLMSELCALSQAYYAFKQFQCVESIRLCKSLPRHSTDARICEMIARCCFEMADYRGAEEWFVKTRSIDPHRVSGMDVFSTALWHLRRDVQLSHLAHELVASHRDTAQAWCAVGNCFSLKREHDVALKCFNRAIQIDETYAYAHTLAGHESVAMEDSEQGLQSYRLAVRIDKRHYNAWFGIATIYLSQEKFDLAEFHLRRALDINPSNPVLILYMGLIAEKKARLPEALKAYTLAASLRPDIPLYAFRRASVLFALQRHEEAQHVLAPLDPGESGVHFLVGRVCAARGDRKGAVRAFTLAQDVASGKVAGAIRDEIEKLVAGGDGREGEGEEAMDGGDLI